MDASLLRLLALYIRGVARLLAAAPPGDPIQALPEWRHVARQTAFLAHVVEDLTKRERS